MKKISIVNAKNFKILTSIQRYPKHYKGKHLSTQDLSNQTMTRSRRNSLVQNIASNAEVSKEANYAINDVLDDTYLFNRLQKLSLALGEVTGDTTSNGSKSSTAQSNEEAETDSNDEYAVYYDYLQRLDDTLANYQQTLTETQLIDTQFNEIISQFDTISHSTTKFIDDTSKFYESHHNLNDLSTTMPQYLNYFDSLDVIMRKLNHSTSSNVVKRDSFTKLLTNIDESLQFLTRHPDLLDGESYRIKFKQCLIRASTLIAHYVNNNLRQIYNEISGKETLLQNPTTREALIYNKFASISEIITDPIQELLKRCYGDDTDKNNYLSKYKDELQSILKDCYLTYFDVRNKLLFSIIWSQLDDIIMKQKSEHLLSFISLMKTYFQELCQNEYKLFIKFFPPNGKDNNAIKDVINNWFLKLCEPLYNTTTNKILREQDINQLCDSIRLFQPFYEFEEGSDEYMKQFNEIYYNKIFEPIVIKLQNQLARQVRLVMTQNLIDYKPTINDLMISNHDNLKKTMRDSEIEMMNNYLETLSQRLLADNTKFDSKDMILLTYYTPLLRSLSLLFKIYDIFIDPSLFDELSHYLIHNGVHSLKRAYEVYKGSSNTLDIKLVYLGNLLLLRDEIQHFNLSYDFDESRSQLSFSPVGTLIKSIKWSNGALFSLAKGLVPRGGNKRNNSVTSMASESSQQLERRENDSRIELIQELRQIIKTITDSISAEIVGNNLVIMDIGTESKEDKPLPVEKLIQNNDQFKGNLETILPNVQTKIMELIHNETICKFLLEAIKEETINEYRQFYTDIQTNIENSKISGEILNDVMNPEVVDGLFYNTVTLMVGS